MFILQTELPEYFHFITDIDKNGEIEFYSKGYFDKETHYYCEKTQGYREDNKYFPITTICRTCSSL